MNAFSLILFNVREALEAATGECEQKVRQKFYEVLQKNPNLETIKKIFKYRIAPCSDLLHWCFDF
jgi:lipopolysaccharide biosynthesis regulator YciM